MILDEYVTIVISESMEKRVVSWWKVEIQVCVKVSE
jgi:hypothetical protein